MMDSTPTDPAHASNLTAITTKTSSTSESSVATSLKPTTLSLTPPMPESPVAMSSTTMTLSHTSPIEISKKVRIKKKLISWMTFSVMIGVFPIVLNVLYAFGNNKPIVFFDLFAHGELLLISVGIAADAIGDLISSGKVGSVNSIISLCCCFLILLFSVSWFASLGIGGSAINREGFGIISLILFLTTVIVSANCKILIEVQDD